MKENTTMTDTENDMELEDDAPIGDVQIEGTETPADAPEAPPEAPEDPAAVKARKEAKGLRERLHAAESERDTAVAALDAMRQREVVRLAAEHLADGSDLIAFGTTVADLIGDDGTVDSEKVRTAADALVTSKPHLRRRTTFGSVDAGPRNLEATRPTGPTWTQALTGRR